MKIHGARPRTDAETIAKRLAELDEGFEALRAILHKFDGTQPGAPMGVREMAVANTNLQTAQLWARLAIEEN